MPSELSADQWRQLESFIDALLDTPPERRAALFAKVSGGDPDRRAELERLIAACERTYPLLDQPAAERFAALIDPGPLRPDDLVAGRYRIENEIGRGGMATVYLAHDLKYARDVALKVVRSELVASVGSKRFLREIEIAAQLRHPNIVPLFDSGEWETEHAGSDGRPAREAILYYAMPYEPGQSLRERLRREGRLSVHDTVIILRDVCEALAHAHAHGVVHRDIKPDNILLSGRHALVSDFGIARAPSEIAISGTATGAGMMIGTPAYMAPEQVAAEPGVDHRADIYALGVVGYELLTGHPPFGGEPREILAAQLSKDPPSLTDLRPDVPNAVAELLMRCLAKSPADRWESASALLPYLEPGTVPTGVPTGATTGGLTGAPASRPRGTTPVPARARRRMSSAVWRWAVSGVAALVVVAGTAWLTWPRSARPPAPVAEASGPPALAVLPFEHGSDDLEPLAMALTGTLIAALVDVSRLDVRSLRAVLPYGETAVMSDSIARRLGVRLIVSGRVYRLGAQNVVTVDLVEAATGSIRASERAVGVPDDDIALIDDIVAKVALMLRERIGDHVRVEEWRIGTRSSVALNDVYRAFDAVREADVLMANDIPGALIRLRQADSTLAEASRADPVWTEPHVQRAWVARKAAFIVGRGGLVPAETRATLGTGLAHAERALRIRPDDPRALEIKGILTHAQSLVAPSEESGRAYLAAAESLLQRATDADSELPRGLNILSAIHATRGELEQARLIAERAHSADAYSEDAEQVLGRLFTIAFETANDAEAGRWCEEYERVLAPHWFVGYCQLMLMAWDSTRAATADEARRVARTAVAAAEPTIQRAIAAQMETHVAAVLARLGQRDEAERHLQSVRSMMAADSSVAVEPHGTALLQFEAAARARLGQADAAAALLTQYMKRQPGSASWLARSRRFRDLPVERLLDVAPAR